MFRAFLVVGVVAATWWIRRQARQSRVALTVLLGESSQIAYTAAGPIEFTWSGPDTSDLALPSNGDAQDNIVLFLHGTPGGSDQGPIVGRLVRPGWHVLAPSRPGYLYTPLDVGRTPAAQADSYKSLLDTLKIKSVVVVAISGAGPSAIEFALRYPDRVRGLILVSAVTASMPGTEPPLVDFMGSDVGTWFLRKLMQYVPGLSRLPLKSSVRQVAMQLIETYFPFDLRRAGLHNDNTQFLELPAYPWQEISVPTLVTHGEDDKVIPLEQARAVAARIPGAGFMVVEESSHVFSIVNSRTITIINEFMAQLPQGALRPGSQHMPIAQPNPA